MNTDNTTECITSKNTYGNDISYTNILTNADTDTDFIEYIS